MRKIYCPALEEDKEKATPWNQQMSRLWLASAALAGVDRSRPVAMLRACGWCPRRIDAMESDSEASDTRFSSFQNVIGEWNDTAGVLFPRHAVMLDWIDLIGGVHQGREARPTQRHVHAAYDGQRPALEETSNCFHLLIAAPYHSLQL